jgi:Xaa-Pro dipeptidase
MPTSASFAPAHRLDRLLDGLRALDAAAAVLVGNSHGTHLTGYSRYFSGPVALVVDRDRRRTLIVPAYELEPATELADADLIVPYGGEGFGLDLEMLPKLIAAAASVAPAGRLGIASEIAGLGEAIAQAANGAAAETVSLDALIHDIRLLKDEDEVAAIVRSFGHCLAAQDAVERLAVAGVREIELFTAAHATAQNEAGAPIEFGCDMLVNARTAEVCVPVCVPGNEHLREGGVVVSDISVRDRGYWGDSARSVVGSSEEVAEAYAVISEILDDAARALVPGAIASAIFEQVHSAIVTRLPGSTFPHHGGHGIGLTSFEDPHLIPGDDTPLQAGMVLAVEPGAYFAGRFGVRVENAYLVTPDGGIALHELDGLANG